MALKIIGSIIGLLLCLLPPEGTAAGIAIIVYLWLPHKT